MHARELRRGVPCCVLPGGPCSERCTVQEGGPRELSSARMHLRGVVRQAGERYSHLPQYTQLQELLDRVEHALQSGAVAR